MTQDEIKDKIIALFQDLPTHRQLAVLRELRQIFDLGIEEDDDE